jgi:CheY-like chemotaxis protein
MAQVAGNLLQNADKFTPPRGTVTVHLSSASGQAELRVRDTGVGIDPKHLHRVFEPFNQEERSLARTRGGLGLGLALTKGLVELHGGSTEALSEGLGRGAEFVVRLPLQAPAPQPDLSPVAPQAAQREGRRVLIVEDNEDAAETLADVLSLEGHHVQIARDGSSGIAMARALEPDVVLCDIGLPDVDGYAVARTLRGEPALRATRLVALSGYAQPEDKLRARDAGFDGHVSKPPALGELSALVARGRRTAAEQR